MDANKITMGRLANQLRLEVDRVPVLDRTGLLGSYQMSMAVPAQWTGAVRRVGPADAGDPIGADIFKSVEKLGLRLEKGKAPIEHLVIDHVEKTPTGN